jgi:hypothetical protein
MTVWLSPYKIIITAIGPSVACVNDKFVIHDRNINAFAVEHRPKFSDQAIYPFPGGWGSSETSRHLDASELCMTHMVVIVRLVRKPSVIQKYILKAPAALVFRCNSNGRSLVCLGCAIR